MSALRTVDALRGTVLMILLGSTKEEFELLAPVRGPPMLAFLSFLSPMKIFFSGLGFFLSVMWSVIFSLALNSLADHHGSFAGILCTGIVGGGLATPIVGLIADPGRLADIRRNRVAIMNDHKIKEYTDLDFIQNEVEDSKKLFKKNNWPIIDVTRKSVEETAASILKIIEIKKNK